ncbi:50S ribosomal protein L16 [Patescibacteria group bacterium]|nr:50S ribosomal protein L16 [Patescibacteria group bacterium]MDE1941308.1 50S ribosomal protein L16 [Patescibacteria group bacterium]
MLFPKKVKHRKWFTMRQHREKEAAHAETRGIGLAFGSYGLKAMKYARVTSNQIEAARKVMARYATKSGKVWIRVFPDHPFTQKPAEVKMGKGKGDPQGFIAEVKPGRIMFEIDGVEAAVAAEALRKAGTKLPVKTKVVSRS